jgi:Tol biopolymer transport system component
MYFHGRLKGAGRTGWDYEIRQARPEGGPFTVLDRVSSARVPFDPKLLTPTLAPDGRWLAMTLADRGTSNVWVLPTGGGPLRQITDFGTRATLIVRSIAWSPDSRAVYAAVADTDADIVLIDHVIR